MINNGFKKMQHEKGMSTLVVVLLLLFVATLVTLYTANSMVREQQVSANQYRSDQALSAANLGLDYAVAYFTKFTGPDANLDGVVDVLTVPSSLLTGLGQTVSARVTFTDGDPLVDRNEDSIFDNDALDFPHTLTATGYSDDTSATRTMELQIGTAGATSGGGFPGFPLIAKGIAGSGGNFSIINRFSNATIWTGSDASTLGSAETYVLDPTNPATTRAELIDITGSPDPNLVLHASYSKAGLNSDVLEGDDNLWNMSDDQFFESFIRENKTTMRGLADSIGQRFDAADITWDQLATAGMSGVVWIDGDWSVSGSLNQLGTEQLPISLFINGDFTSTGSGTPGIDIIGLLYVIEDWDSGGNFEIQGGAIIEGNVDNKGTPTIVYDEDLYNGSLGVPPGGFAVVMTGTWKDW